MTTEVKPIPDGFHTITPSITVSDGAKAIEFYKRALAAEELGRHTTPDGSKITHADLKVGNSIFFLNDEFPEMGACASGSGNAVKFNLYVEDADSWYARAVEAGATSVMPVTDMFWGDRWGSVTDPFGYQWSFCTHVRDVSPEEINEAAKEIFGKKSDESEAAHNG
jgi:uncharacterized glyoxalase superfamily protein PhnB